MLVEGKYYRLSDIKQNVDMNVLAQKCGWTYKGKKGNSNIYVRGSGKVQESIRVVGPEKSRSGYWNFMHEQQGIAGTNTHLVAYSNFNYGINEKNDEILDQIVTYIVKEMRVEGSKAFATKSAAPVPVIIAKEEKELPFEPSFEHPYLEFRGIPAQAYNHKNFKGTLGRNTNFPHEVIRKGETVILPQEAINYNPEDAMFPVTVAAFKNIEGKIINKEFVNRYTDEVFAKNKKQQRSQSIRRFYEGGVRGNSLFRSNIPEGNKATHLFLGEAWIDVISYFHLHSGKAGFEHLENDTVFTAHGGQITQGQIRMMNHLIREHKIDNIILSNDYDKKGFIYNLTLLGHLSRNDLPFTFEAKGDKSRAGITVNFLGIQEKDYKEISKQLKECNLTGGVEIDASARSFAFLFTQENFKKVGSVLVKYRTPEITGVKVASTFPAGYNDWNDQLMAKPNEKAGILEEDNVPLATYLKKLHNIDLSERKLQLAMLKIEQAFSPKYNPYVDVYDAAKNWMVGRFNLDTLQYEPDGRYPSYTQNEQVQADVNRIKDYFSPEPLLDAELYDAALSGVSIEGKKVLLNEKVIGEISAKGKIDLADDVELEDNHFDALDIIQANLKAGLPWDTIVREKGSSIVYNGIPVLQFSADSKLHETEFFSQYAEAVSLQAEIIQRLRPPRYIPSVLDQTSIEVKEGRLWYGNYELGQYDEVSRKFKLYPAMSEVILPDAFYQDLDKIREIGYQDYRYEIQNPKSFLVNMRDRELSHNGVSIGFLDNSGKILLDRNTLSYEAIKGLETLHVPASQIAILDNGRSHRFAYTRDTDFALQEHQESIKLNVDSNMVLLGDTQIGTYSPATHKIELLPYIPKSQPLEEAVEKFRATDWELDKEKISPRLTIMTYPDFKNGVNNSVQIDLTKCASLNEVYEQIADYTEANGLAIHEQSDFEKVVVVSGIEGINAPPGISSLEKIFELYQIQSGMINLEDIKNNEMKQNDAMLLFTQPDKSSEIQIENDPKFEGILEMREGQMHILAKIPSKGNSTGIMMPLEELEKVNGYFISKPGNIVEKEYRVFQCPADLLTHYKENRDSLAVNDEVGLIAPISPSEQKLAVLQAAIRCPGKIKIYGEQEFVEKISGLARKFISSVEVNPSPEAKPTKVFQPLDQEHVHLIRGLIAAHEHINVVEKDNTGEFYFPTMAISNQKPYRAGLYQGKAGDIWFGSTAQLESFTTPTVPVMVISDRPDRTLDATCEYAGQTGVITCSIVSEGNGLTKSQENVLSHVIEKYDVQIIRIDPAMNPQPAFVEALKQLGIEVSMLKVANMKSMPQHNRDNNLDFEQKVV